MKQMDDLTYCAYNTTSKRMLGFLHLCFEVTVMSINEVISLLSGIALFLFGMGFMGDSLKKLSGSRLEPVLYRLSGTTLKGVLLGTGITAIIQSSCATAVMTVGFVNAGMMKVKQGVGIILGAILGTSITGWIICLSYIEGTGSMAKLISTSTLTGIVALTGISLKMAAKRQSLRYFGDILMGFAVLMYGMSAMSGAVSNLGKSAWFTTILTNLTNPFFGIFIGAAFTVLLQSASAAVGILQALSVTGVMSFEITLPILMGITVGASAPVMISAIGANAGGVRTALIYPIATGGGMLITAGLFYLADSVFRFPFTSDIMDPFSIAAVNTILRLAMLLLLVPLADVIEGIVTTLVPDDSEKKHEPGIHLEERFIDHPALAVEQSRNTIHEMASLAERSFAAALSLFSNYSEQGFSEVKKMENDVDAYEDSLGTYLIKLTGHELTNEQNEEITRYLHTLTDFERISDHAMNLAGSAQELYEKKEQFSEESRQELDILYGAVSQAVCMAVSAFCSMDLATAKRVEPLEEAIDDLCIRMKLNHVERLQQGVCSIPLGFVFNDIITNCERISDHCSNIAVAMIELSQDTFQAHEYSHALHEKGTPLFREAYEEYSRRFAI